MGQHPDSKIQSLTVEFRKHNLNATPRRFAIIKCEGRTLRSARSRTDRVAIMIEKTFDATSQPGTWLSRILADRTRNCLFDLVSLEPHRNIIACFYKRSIVRLLAVDGESDGNGSGF
jgi:hypothetical protein